MFCLLYGICIILFYYLPVLIENVVKLFYPYYVIKENFINCL